MTVSIESKFRDKLYFRNRKTSMALCIDQDLKLCTFRSKFKRNFKAYVHAPSDSRTNLKIK